MWLHFGADGVEWFVFSLQHRNPADQEVPEFAPQVEGFDSVIVAPLPICDFDLDKHLLTVKLESTVPQDDLCGHAEQLAPLGCR